MLAASSLNFIWNVLISPLFLSDVFTGLRIVNWRFFNILKIFLQSSASHHFICNFSDCFQDFVITFGFQQFVCLMWLSMYLSHLESTAISEGTSLFSAVIFFMYFYAQFSVFSFWDSIYIYVQLFILSHRSLRVLFISVQF